jgi:hypothetical protein
MLRTAGKWIFIAGLVIGGIAGLLLGMAIG